MCNWCFPYQVEIPGFDSYGGPCYIGTGCFHRRDTLCGKKYSQDCKSTDWIKTVGKNDRKVEESAAVLEETCKVLASCCYEENTLWGKEVFFTPSVHSHTHFHIVNGYKVK